MLVRHACETVHASHASKSAGTLDSRRCPCFSLYAVHSTPSSASCWSLSAALARLVLWFDTNTPSFTAVPSEVSRVRSG